MYVQIIHFAKHRKIAEYGTGKSLAFGTIEFLRIPRSTHCIKYFSKVIHNETSSFVVIK